MKARSLIRFQLASGILLAAIASSAFAQFPFLDGKAGEKPTLAPLLQKVTPAVVSIVVEGHVQVQTGSPFNDPFLERFFGVPDQPQSIPQEGAGSGVIIDAEKGYVLTNNHVIANADKVMVYLKDKREYDAKVIGSDEGTDIALLQIDADNLTALKLGDSDSLQVGDFVLAIGNPFGLGQTVTSGIVSALGRSGINPEGYEDFIQTDASINPGNSGGALVDLDGELVGINSAIIAPAGGNVGIGFAVPSNMAESVVTQLLENGEVRRGLLGVQIGDLSPDLAKSLNLSVRQGAVVHEVEPDSPAEHAGLQPGDVIIGYDGSDVEGMSDLRNKVALDTPGKTVRLTLLRDGQRQTVNVTIGQASGGLAAAGPGGGQTIDKLEGAEFRNLAPGDPQYRRVQGVLVSRVAQGSPAEQRGLMQGDVITAVNYRAVGSVQELTSAIASTSGAFGLGILRDGRSMFLVVR